MNIINYSQEYENQIVKLWNETLSNDKITVKKFRNNILFDDNFNEQLNKIALINGEVVGFISAVKRKIPYGERGVEPEKAWILAFFVKKEFRRQKIATSLVNAVEEIFNDGKTQRIIVGPYSPNYIMPGIDINNYKEAVLFFNNLKYNVHGETYSMNITTHNYITNAKLLEKKQALIDQGYKIERFSYDYSLKLLQFLLEEFGAGWKNNALNAMKWDKAQERIILLLNNEDEIVGFCMRAIDNNEMRFGPIGVKSTERNGGLGAILIDELIHWCKEQSIFHLYFITTDPNGRRFYERIGFTCHRTFAHCSKEVENNEI